MSGKLNLMNLLISGTSHTGKSSLADVIGKALGCKTYATDGFARHPGRPWPNPAPHVAEYFAALSGKTIYQFLLNHHENMWPQLQKLILEKHAAGETFILEGSALRPEYTQTIAPDMALNICLYADDDFLRERMRQNSSYTSRDANMQHIVDKFIDRSLMDNTQNIIATKAHGIECFDVACINDYPGFCADLTQRLRD